jgi:hypothetical protein
VAQVVQDLFRDTSHLGPRHYPWDQWFDGQAWELRQGEDFPGGIESFRANLCRMARQRGVKVRTTTQGKAIRFQVRGGQ